MKIEVIALVISIWSGIYGIVNFHKKTLKNLIQFFKEHDIYRMLLKWTCFLLLVAVLSHGSLMVVHSGIADHISDSVSFLSVWPVLLVCLIAQILTPFLASCYTLYQREEFFQVQTFMMSLFLYGLVHLVSIIFSVWLGINISRSLSLLGDGDGVVAVYFFWFILLMGVAYALVVSFSSFKRGFNIYKEQLWWLARSTRLERV